MLRKNLSYSGGRGRAFTLIEVVISLAVVSLAIVAIMGLLGVFLQGTKAVIERNEALSICQALNTYLQEPDYSTNPPTQGFDKVYKWFSASGQANAPQLYAFSLPTKPSSGAFAGTLGTTSRGLPEMQIVCPGNPGTADSNYGSYTNRVGRLFYINLTLSPNVPVHVGVARTPVTLTVTSSLPAVGAYPSYTPGSGICTDTSFYADSSIPLSVRIYAVAVPLTAGATPSTLQTTLETVQFNYPILMYDTVVNR